MKPLHGWRAFGPSLFVIGLAIGVALTSSGRASAGPLSGVSPDERAALLADHNAWRAHYGSPALVWDDNLAVYAGAWATQLANTNTFEHRPNNTYGENIWTGTAGWFPITDVTKSWSDEVKDYNIATNTCSAGAVCGHFTQVVWYTTRRIGCGKATGGGQDYVVCNYDPPGNYDGESPFGPR